MNEDLENLERQIEEQWSALGLDLSVDLPAAVVERVRSGVRHELNEAWLSGQSQPVPDDALLGRVADEVHRELDRMTLGRARIVRLRRWLVGGAAAAAAILLVVALPRFGGPPQTGGRGMLPADAEAIERFVQAADQVWSADPLTREIREDLDAIEESVTQWPPGGESESESLDDLNSRLDSPRESGIHDGLSDAGGLWAGAMA